MSEKLSFLNRLMNTNGISLADISNYFYNNESKIVDSKNIFNCLNYEDFLEVATIVELLYPEKSKNRYIQNYLFKESGKWRQDMQNEKKSRERKTFIITAMLYNTPFYVYAINWCYFMRLATDRYYDKHKNKKYYVLDQSLNGYGSKIFEIGDPVTIEGAGVLTVTGRSCVNGEKKTSFNFEFDEKILARKRITISIYYDDNIETRETIVLDSNDLIEGKTKIHKTVELDFENGFEASWEVINL